jgi:hypothetical protein
MIKAAAASFIEQQKAAIEAATGVSDLITA